MGKRAGRKSRLNRFEALEERVLLSLLFTGDQALARLGWSTSSVGNVLDDRARDLEGQELLIGEPFRDEPGRIDSGAVYLIFGGEHLGTDDQQGAFNPRSDQAAVEIEEVLLAANGIRFIGATAGEWAGYSVASVGNVIGGPGDDILIGAPGADWTSGLPGRVYLIGDDLIETVYRRAVAILAAGDDLELDDVTIDLSTLDPATWNPANGSFVIFEGANANDRVGFAVAGIGDRFFVIGAPGYEQEGEAAQTNRGAVYVIHPREYLYENQLIRLTQSELVNTGRGNILIGPEPGAYFGSSVSGIGDPIVNSGGTPFSVDGEPEPDFLIGAPHVTLDRYYRRVIPLLGSGRGTVYVVPGVYTADQAISDVFDFSDPGTLQTLGVVPVRRPAGVDYLGANVSQAGDLDVDGLPDFMFSAPAVDGGAGRVYVVFGREFGDTFVAGPQATPINPDSFPGRIGLTLNGASPGENAGVGLSGGINAGDPNIRRRGDDIFIGAPFADIARPGQPALIEAGRTYAILGTPDFQDRSGDVINLVDLLSESEEGVVLSGRMTDQWFGFSIAALGNVYDFPGIPTLDFIVGAPEATTVRNNAPITDAGEAELFFGIPGLLPLLPFRRGLAPGAGTVWQPDPALPTVIFANGFASMRMLSTLTGKIEADQTGLFGDDLFVISRGLPQQTDGILPPIGPDVIGTVYRVDPYGTLATTVGTISAADNRRVFGIVPGTEAGVDEDLYPYQFDIAFDINGRYNRLFGEPVMFVSVADRDATGSFNPQNAIYAFTPSGKRYLFAYSARDADGDGRLDNVPAAIAVANDPSFGQDLYVMDGVDDDFYPAPEPGQPVPDEDGNVLYRVSPETTYPVNLDATAVLHPRTEITLPELFAPPNDEDILPLANPRDMDVRAMVFDPNANLIQGGQYGTPAYRFYGGLFVASSDVRGGENGLTRILHYPTLSTPPVDLIGPRSILENPNITGINAPPMLIGDMAFDRVGFFGGGLFVTDYQSKAVYQIQIDPRTGNVIQRLFAVGFNVPDPDPDVDETPTEAIAEALATPFSITFSRDGQVVFVSDADGIWAFYANTLAHSPAGAIVGLTDVREARMPYDGAGFGAAVIDSGVDGDHLGFMGTVTPGFDPVSTAPGNVDPDGHGTAVAGIIHQIVPEAVIVPAKLPGIVRDAESLYQAVRWVRQNPFTDDPRTLRRERYPIVAVNMSLGLRAPDDPDTNVDSDLDAVRLNKTEAIPLKYEFRRYYKAHRYGIVPVAAAGNEGMQWNGDDGSSVPAVLNEVVEVIASYPYGPVPPGTPPPITSDLIVRCELELGDLIAFPGKITAFSSRNVVSDFAAPGTCVNTFGRSLLGLEGGSANDYFGMAPIYPFFNGTSAATPFVTGAFVFGYDVVDTWAKLRRRGGRLSWRDQQLGELFEYLVRPFASAIRPEDVRIEIPRAAIPRFEAYLNPHGINSLLQWTAVPREDVNIGESYEQPTGSDDLIQQRRLLFSDRYRTYSHLNIAQLAYAVEGSVAFRYFDLRRDQWELLLRAAGTPGRLTLDDIDAFVADPVNDPTARAMAALLGSAKRVAGINRFRFYDLVADGRPDDAIGRRQLKRIIRNLLPGPTAFPITNRWKAARKGYAIDRTALRNYHDLIYLRRDAMVWDRLPPAWRDKSPAQLSRGVRRLSLIEFLPVEPQEGPGTGVTDAYELRDDTGNAVGQQLSEAILVQPGRDSVAQASTTQGMVVVGVRPAMGQSVELRVFRKTADGQWQLVERDVSPLAEAAVGELLVGEVDAQLRVYGLTADGKLAIHVVGQPGWLTVEPAFPAGHDGGLRTLGSLFVQPGAPDAVLLTATDRLGHVVELSVLGEAWSVQHVGPGGSIASLLGREPVPLRREDGSEVGGGKLLYVVDRHGRLRELRYRPTQGWSADVLRDRQGRAVVVDGVLAAYELTNSRGRKERHLLARGKNGELVHLRRRAGYWQIVRPRLPDGHRKISGELSVHVQPGTGRFDTVVQDVHGDLIVLRWNGRRWQSAVRTPLKVTGDLVGHGTRRRLVAEAVDQILAELRLVADQPVPDVIVENLL